MNCSYYTCLEEEVRKIIGDLSAEDPEGESGQIICTADQGGMSSGVPGAFSDALDRFDPTGFTNERFHVLIAELIFIAGRERQSALRAVKIQIEGNNIQFTYSP